LAFCDSLLLATVLTGALAWAWYKHHSSASSSPAPAQEPFYEYHQTPGPERVPDEPTVCHFEKTQRIETIEKFEEVEEVVDDILEVEEDFGEALEKSSNVELIGSIKNLEPVPVEIVKIESKIDPIVTDIDIDPVDSGTYGFCGTEPLKPSEIQETLTKTDVEVKNFLPEVESFDVNTLKKTEVEEKNLLPDLNDINQEKEKVDHLSGIENFNTETLTKVKTPEPISGAELLKNELNQKAISDQLESYNKEELKHVDVEEKVVLPDSETLQAEKSRESLLTGVAEFSKESLSHVQTQEPLSGAELLKQELSIKSLTESVSSFDTSSLKPSETEEKNVLPDAETLKSEKDHFKLLRELESGTELSPTVSKEPLSGIDLLKQELTHNQLIENVTGFDKQQLKEVESEEKSVLPDADTIQSEKSHIEHLSNIASFDQSALAKVKVSEPLSGVEIAKQESFRTSISDELVSFDRSELKHTETVEKISLPDDDVISSEKQHQEFLSGVQTGVELKKTETREPFNPLDLAKLEVNKDQVEEEIQAFDRSRLTPVATEEKQILPTAEDIKTEALHKELDSLDRSPVDVKTETLNQELDSLDKEPEEAKGASGVRDFLSEEIKETDDSSSSPEELPGAGVGASALKNILERENRERSSSGEEWEKVSINTEEYTGTGPAAGSSEC